MKKSFLLISLSTLILTAANNCINEKTTQPKTLDLSTINSYALSFPINATLPEKKRIHLLVKPENVKLLNKENFFNQINSNSNPKIYEFIPQTDTSDDFWSHIITCTAYIGNKFESDAYAKAHINYIKNMAHTTKVISINSRNENGFKTTTFIMTYCEPNKKSRPEILWSKIYSGPYDTAIISYGIALTQDCDEEKAIKIITNFMNKNTQIITC